MSCDSTAGYDEGQGRAGRAINTMVAQLSGDSGQPGHPAWYRDGARWRAASKEIAGTAIIMALYFLVRGMRPEVVDESVARSLQIVQFEQQIGIFHEVAWQQAFLPHGWAISIANFIYAWLHYPVMLLVALWLVIKDPWNFRFVRNVLIVSALIGIFSYWVLPAAPPRLMELHGYDFGFVDTVHGDRADVFYFQPGPFVNDYAAVPSFHFGWIALSSAAIWVNSTNRWVRAGAVFMSLVMWWAVTVTGNHYFFDMIMGGLVVFFSWMLVAWLHENGTDGIRRKLSSSPPDSGNATTSDSDNAAAPEP